MEIRHLFESQVQRLAAEKYSPEEAKVLVFWLLDHYYQYSRSDLASGKELPGDPSPLLNAVNDLLMDIPIQYVTGKAHFYGRDFFVDPSVLIPRRETEELVYWILSEPKSFPLKILDIGTGSGCIPITIKAECPNASVFAADISRQALTIAQKNAEFLQAKVDFFLADVFNWPQGLPDDFSILVSNPPYICESEKAQMKKNVLDHEPELALFVSDKDPLVFYKAIGKLGQDLLCPSGLLFVEINENFGSQTMALLEEIGYQDLVLKKDMQGKERMIRARIP